MIDHYSCSGFFPIVITFLQSIPIKNNHLLFHIRHLPIKTGFVKKGVMDHSAAVSWPCASRPTGLSPPPVLLLGLSGQQVHHGVDLLLQFLVLLLEVADFCHHLVMHLMGILYQIIMLLGNVVI